MFISLNGFGTMNKNVDMFWQTLPKWDENEST